MDKLTGKFQSALADAQSLALGGDQQFIEPVHVMIALLDQGHLLHQPATLWLEGQLAQGWATCPITENGVVRIMAQPAYPNCQPAAMAASRLAEA